jgi:transposase
MAHLSEEEIDERLRHTTGFWRVQRWLAIRHALLDPAPARVIGQRVGLAEQTVHNLIAAYNRHGAAAVETPGRGQRQRAAATLEEEASFLAEFAAESEAGQVSTVARIKQAWEQRIGHSVHASTIYRMLRRHGWRKLVPRPRHVKTDPEAQAAFKKNSPSR